MDDSTTPALFPSENPPEAQSRFTALRQKLLTLLERSVEAAFILAFVLIVPIWFPLLIAYVLIDPLYHLALRRSGKANERWRRSNRDSSSELSYQ